MKKLNNTEWQRWTPVLGFGRLLKDIINFDNDLLAEMHPISYTIANITYNVSAMIAGTSLFVNYLLN
jgi:hypothetical protein